MFLEHQKTTWLNYCLTMVTKEINREATVFYIFTGDREVDRICICQIKPLVIILEPHTVRK